VRSQRTKKTVSYRENESDAGNGHESDAGKNGHESDAGNGHESDAGNGHESDAGNGHNGNYSDSTELENSSDSDQQVNVSSRGRLRRLTPRAKASLLGDH
jgi:hypothetical protein